MKKWLKRALCLLVCSTLITSSLAVPKKAYAVTNMVSSKLLNIIAEITQNENAAISIVNALNSMASYSHTYKNAVVFEFPDGDWGILLLYYAPTVAFTRYNTLVFNYPGRYTSALYTFRGTVGNLYDDYYAGSAMNVNTDPQQQVISVPATIRYATFDLDWESMDIPDFITVDIDEELVRKFDYDNDYATRLNNATYSFNTEAEDIKDLTLSNIQTDELVIPSRLNGFKVTTLPSDMVATSNNTVTSLSISEGVQTIEENALDKFDALEEIIIPASVTSIGENEQLETVTVYGYTGTAAQTYSLERNINFESLGTLENDMIEVTDGDKAYMDILVHIASDFSVRIPKSISSVSETIQYKIGVKGEISVQDAVSVVPNSDELEFTCNEQSIMALVSQPKQKWIRAEVTDSAWTETVGTITVEDGITPGDWTSLLSFTISLDEGGAEQLAAGVYDETGTMTYSWDELVDDGYVNVDEIASFGLRSSNVRQVVTTLYDAESDTNTSEDVIEGRLVIPEGVTDIGEYGLASLSKMTAVVLPSTCTNVADNAFRGASKLNEIKLDSVINIGSGALADCDNLTKVELSNQLESIDSSLIESVSDKLTVQYKGNTYNNGTVLDVVLGVENVNMNETVKEIREPGLYDYRTGEMTYSWDELISLEYVKVTNGVASVRKRDYISGELVFPSTLVTIGRFDGCKKLIAVYIPETVNVLNSTFEGCTNLRYAETPVLSEYMFDGCSQLAEVKLIGNIKSIGAYAFNACSSLTNINIPDTVTTISDQAFRSCNSITEIRVPAGASCYQRALGSGGARRIYIAEGTERITYWMLGDSSYLQAVYLPSTITSIDAKAFYQSGKLSDIYFAGTKEQWDAIPKGADWNTSTNTTLGLVVHYNVKY